MSGKRIIRFFLGLLISVATVPFILPLFGVPRSHYLPPMWVYNAATGTAGGIVTDKHSEASNDPFRIGDRLYFVDYKFSARPPTKTAQGDPNHMQDFTGEIMLEHETYHNILVGQPAPVKYEITYPDINGINSANGGEGCTPPNTIRGPWLIWLGLMIAVAVGIMLIFDQIGTKEDI